ncbi:SMAD/FHA domain-containing protein [Epithele typhae]|uniref:SMAD/FHA domain-containing protein n=1 Tax=Epithele typhae TaxID=378194 RepID=UPI0020075F7D|nr:SMAD/FHA domain-containing protein [Epithele typhae]KAH9919455.1 SMAD/FHA domain-containing protein [Epithele typhae]
MDARRRQVGTLAAGNSSHAPAVAVARTVTGPAGSTAASAGTGPAHRIRLVPHLDSRRSLRFDPISRDVREGDAPLRIGRFTDRSGMGIAAANAIGSNKLAFKSKVVSRAHAEIWSSSGTFLNHVRLSTANNESRAHEIKDGDMLQLGVDYQGGTEDIYKCVKIKIEVGREWQNHSNPFNVNALKQLKSIALPLAGAARSAVPVSAPQSVLYADSTGLFSVTIHQALFIAPCSHAFHYKCIRPLLENHHPAFSCPLCRTFANLEEDVEVEIDPELDTASLADVAAIAIAGTIAGDRPNTGDASSRERGHDRDVADAGANRLGASRRRAPPVPGASANGHLGHDETFALPPLPESSSMLAVEQVFGDGMNGRESSASPVTHPGEGDVEVEGGSSDGSGHAGDAGLHGKRKR